MNTPRTVGSIKMVDSTIFKRTTMMRMVWAALAIPRLTFYQHQHLYTEQCIYFHHHGIHDGLFMYNCKQKEIMKCVIKYLVFDGFFFRYTFIASHSRALIENANKNLLSTVIFLFCVFYRLICMLHIAVDQKQKITETLDRYNYIYIIFILPQ